VIFLVANLAAGLFERLNQPPSSGNGPAGVLIGPYC
jgi:Kef-type K+ transport system membrane component KefB